MINDTLIIFDHIDELWTKHGPQFRWWIIDVADRFKATILLISRERIDTDLADSEIIEPK